MQISRPQYVMHLAVVPAYRTECMVQLKVAMGDDLQIITSSAHLDQSVRTGIPEYLYQRIPMLRIGGIAFLQLGGWRKALNAQVAMIDLNPRSLSAWAILTLRRSLGRRTLVWGHLHGRGGGSVKTAPLRHFMRGLADGFVAYTYSSADEARRSMPAQQVWVAPNALYSIEQLKARTTSPGERRHLVYVGRFEKEKKVEVAIRGLARLVAEGTPARLVLVGAGAEEDSLRSLVSALGLDNDVEWPGWVSDLEELKGIYARAFCSISPGFIGLGLTQSLGFGVPMVASRDEPHSPEVELAGSGGVSWFMTNDDQDFARAVRNRYDSRASVPITEFQEHIWREYSADAMADGLARAFMNLSQGDHRD